MQTYNSGSAGEDAVMDLLKSRGWEVYRSPGSRGPADIFAVKKSKKWCIQVKVRSSGRKIARKDEERLIRYSCISCCTPVIALVNVHSYSILNVAANILDAKDNMIIRDILGNLVAINLGNSTLLYLYDLRTGKCLEP